MASDRAASLHHCSWRDTADPICELECRGAIHPCEKVGKSYNLLVAKIVRVEAQAVHQSVELIEGVEVDSQLSRPEFLAL